MTEAKSRLKGSLRDFQKAVFSFLDTRHYFNVF